MCLEADRGWERGKGTYSTGKSEFNQVIGLEDLLSQLSGEEVRRSGGDPDGKGIVETGSPG